MNSEVLQESSYALKIQQYMREYWDSAAERLIRAIDACDLDEVETLIAQGMDPHVSPNGGEPPLIQAIIRGRVEMVDLLLKHGVSPETLGKEGQNALMEAAQRGYEPTARRLLSADANPNTQTPCGRTALWDAVDGRYYRIVAMLLAKGANPDGDGGKCRKTPLMKAASQGDFEMVRFLLRKGADPNLQTVKEGWSALGLAASRGHERVVFYLVARGANADLVDVQGRTPLVATLAAGHCHLAYALVRFTKNLEAQDQEPGWTAVAWAAARGDLHTLHRLWKQGAQLSTPGKQGETPIALAENSGHTKVVQWLLRRGVRNT